MGVLNVTPDSFSDGGRHLECEAAVAHGLALFGAGADIVDVGGESSRPGGACRVDVGEELRRVIPVVRALRRRCDGWISVDTSKAAVAEAALDAGADIINDVSALRFDAALGGVAARHGVPLVLMHSRGGFAELHDSPHYEDVMGEIVTELRHALGRAGRAGVALQQTIVDPGIGFAKQAGHSLEVLRRLDEMARLDRPVLIGPSRKSVIGHVLDRPVGLRKWGTAAAVAVCAMGGAHIVRVHEVDEMRDVTRIVDAVRGEP
ncbi:MAG: dihydropteroate synthase [Vicinamibacteria bacterium]|nr:dihydropteroate synthase [Vicinamibacteria bacterium]